MGLSLGHSSVMDVGRQVEHMALLPMTGGLLLWRRRNGTDAKSFCLLTSWFSSWSPENLGQRSRGRAEHPVPIDLTGVKPRMTCIFGLWAS